MATLEQSSVLSQLFPSIEENTDAVVWDIRDNVGGLIPYSPVNDPFPVLNPAGITRRMMTPGDYAAEMILDGRRIKAGGKPGTLGDTIDVSAELDDMSLQLQIRGLQTREKAMAQLLTTGVVTATDKDGTVIDIARWDGWGSQYTALAGGDKWDAPTTAAPVALLRERAASFAGSGHNLGSGVVLANSNTLAKMFATTDVKTSIKGKFGSTIASPNQFNEFFRGDSGFGSHGELPLVVGVDDGVVEENGSFSFHIPNGYVVLAARNPLTGLALGNYVFTRNVQLLAPGIYANNARKPLSPYLPYTEISFSGGVRVNYSKQFQVVKVY